MERVESELGEKILKAQVGVLMGGIRRAPEIGGAGVIFGAEMGRMAVLRPTDSLFPVSEEYASEHPELITEPSVTAENTPDFLYESLNHSGNIIDGYAITMGLYYAQSVLLKNKLSEKIRLGTSWVVSNLIVAGVETGVIHDQPTDLLDIPAGVAGSTLFLGVHLFSKLKYRKWLEKEGLNEENFLSGRTVSDNLLGVDKQ